MPRGGMKVNKNDNVQGGIEVVCGHLVFIVFAVRHIESKTLNWQHSLLYVNASEGHRLNLMLLRDAQILWSGAGCAQFQCSCTRTGHGNGFGTQRRGGKTLKRWKRFHKQRARCFLVSFENYF